MLAADERRDASRARHYRFDDFTHPHYRELLEAARARYAFRPFTAPCAEQGVVLWRHDIDLSVHAAAHLAEIEHAAGVRATYFVMLHCEFYHFWEAEVSRRLRRIVELGHHLGLHFDPGFYGPITDAATLERHLASERGVLEAVYRTPVEAFSFHNPEPAILAFDADEYAGMRNTYGRSLRESTPYCSDSNGYWRHQRLADVLEAAPPRLHVLTHPGWWRRDPKPPRERVRQCIDGRSRRVLEGYDAVLRRSERENVDWSD